MAEGEIVRIKSLCTSKKPPFPFIRERRFLVFSRISYSPRLSSASASSSDCFRISTSRGTAHAVTPP